jgi:hypothetical protein
VARVFELGNHIHLSKVKKDVVALEPEKKVQKMLSTFCKMLVQHFSKTTEFSFYKEMFGSILFQKILVQFF